MFITNISSSSSSGEWLKGNENIVWKQRGLVEEDSIDEATEAFPEEAEFEMLTQKYDEMKIKDHSPSATEQFLKTISEQLGSLNGTHDVERVVELLAESEKEEIFYSNFQGRGTLYLFVIQTFVNNELLEKAKHVYNKAIEQGIWANYPSLKNEAEQLFKI